MKQFDGYKKCSGCNCIYPIIMYWNNKSTLDGLCHECIDCVEDRRKSNLERHAESSRKWRQENLEYAREYDRKRYKKRLEDGYFTESQKRYRKTRKGKLCVAKGNHKRYTKYKTIPILINPFPKEIEIEYHHINDLLVIPLPKISHRQFMGKEHREKTINVIDNIYGLNIEKLMEE